jgi:hypothetical protein
MEMSVELDASDLLERLTELAIEHGRRQQQMDEIVRQRDAAMRQIAALERRLNEIQSPGETPDTRPIGAQQ